MSFPNTIDSFRELEDYPGVVVEPDRKDTVYAQDTIELQQAIIAIETVLGIEPAAPNATVKARLAAIAASVTTGDDNILAILGATPQGAYATVKARLDAMTSSINTLETGLQAANAAILAQQIPVGGLYSNADSSADPATALGYGTWARFGKGRVLVSKADSGTFATNGATGGAETHTLTISEMPSHNHTMGDITLRANAGALDSNSTNLDDFPGSNGPIKATNVQVGNAWNGNMGFTGGGAAHNNLQPYIVVYTWKRTA